MDIHLRDWTTRIVSRRRVELEELSNKFEVTAGTHSTAQVHPQNVLEIPARLAMILVIYQFTSDQVDRICTLLEPSRWIPHLQH